MSVGVY